MVNYLTVAIVAKLKKKHLQKADKIPKTDDQKIFSLDGRLVLSIEFDGKSLTTPVYLKMDSPDRLLLSEGVCRQLGIIVYNNEVCSVKTNSGKTAPRDKSLSTVPLVQVSLIKKVNLLPHRSIVAQVNCDTKSQLNNRNIFYSRPVYTSKPP